MSLLGKTLQPIVNAAWHATRQPAKPLEHPQSTVPLEAKASKAGKLISMNLVGQPVWTPRQYDKLAEESYAKNVVAYRAISEIAKCIGSVPFQLFQKGAKKTELEDHALLDLLARPNPLQGRASFLQSVAGFYMIAGNSYLEAVGPARSDNARPVRELWPKRPDRMKVVPGERGLPAAYEFSVNGQSVSFPVTQRNGKSSILHLKSFHPLNDWYGMSAIEAAAFSIDQHNEAGAWNMALLQNAARPSGALVLDPKSGIGLDEPQYQRLKASMEEQYSGPSKAGRPLLLEGGLDWKAMSLNPIEMDWLEGKHTSARDVAMALGMPAQMLGIPGDNTHRNMEEARLWLWEQTIIPMLDYLLQELNWWLTPLFGEKLELSFNLDEVPALITRRYMLWDKITKSDFLMLDEKRRAVGYEDLPPASDEEAKKTKPGAVVLVPTNRQDLEDLDAEPPAVPNPEGNPRDDEDGASSEEDDSEPDSVPPGLRRVA